MPRIIAINQATFIAALAPPNNTGVCFSLSVDWLANNCNLAQLSPFEDNQAARAATAGAIWTVGSNDSRNKTQTAANWFATRTIAYPDLVSTVRSLYPAIRNVLPVAPGPATATTFANLNASVTGGTYNNKLIWLRPTMAAAAAGNRGHVVACNVNMNLWFDANSGVYSGGNTAADFANHVQNTYNPGGAAAGPYPTYLLVQLDVS